MFRNAVIVRLATTSTTAKAVTSSAHETDRSSATTMARFFRHRKEMDMRKSYPSRAFTIIELLVVVSIIALLVGILLPAIGRARDQAQLTRSQANLKQMGTAAATYGAEWKDRQLTYVNDNIQRYGTGGYTATAAVDAFTKFEQVNGYEHPMVCLGYTQGVVWFYAQGKYNIPIDWTTKLGAFRVPNGRQFSQYLNGRFYDPIYYAPKDTAVMASVEQFFDSADEWVHPNQTGGSVKFSSYCFSPAAMFSPDVFSYNKANGKYYTDEWTLPGGFRSPSYSSAQYSNLKTHMTEHHWLQNRKKACQPALTGGIYDGCQPYFYNGSFESAPVTLFYDNHVGTVGQRDAIDACARAAQQTGHTNGGTWSIDTPLGGGYADNAGGGYYMDYGLDWTSTSYHILTIDGIKGRDVLSQ
jgi:prepilin-type N-terminal cleavage/methylation domain-containing protein